MPPRDPRLRSPTHRRRQEPPRHPTLGQTHTGPAPSADSQVSTLGDLLLKAGDPITAVRDIVFSLGALTFYYLLYTAKLVPRWLSGWGIVGTIGYLAAGVIAVFSTELVVMLLPLALQEMVMAAWLIAKGFNTSAIVMLAPPRVAVTSGRS